MCFELSLEGCGGNVLDELRKPFERIGKLHFSTDQFGDLKISEDLKLTQLFPELRILEVGHTSVADWAFFDGHFPHLFMLELHKQIPDVQPHVVDFLKNNTRIETLIIDHINPQLLMEVRENLPLLRSLRIVLLAEDSNQRSNTINFNTVTKFTLESYHSIKIPDYITFDRLEELIFEIEHELTNQFFEFISKQVNTNLGKFRIWAKTISRENLLTIPVELPALKEVIIQCWSKLTADDIGQFLKMNQHLKTLDLFAYIDESEQQKLYAIISNNWDFGIIKTSRIEVKITK